MRSVRRGWGFVLVSCLLAFAVIPQCAAIRPPPPGHGVVGRALIDPPASSSSSSSSSAAASSTTSSAPASSSSSSSSSSAPPSSSSSSSSSSAPTSSPGSSSSSSSSVSGTTTGLPIGGGTTSSGPAQTSSAASNGGNNNTGLSTGSIVAMGVAGGVAGLAILAFLGWKFTRKRMHDFDDNEEIKWPDLNAHGGAPTHPLPTNSTGRSGFGDNESEIDIPAGSGHGYSNSMAPSSIDLNHGGDPYAVPPLPHLNPNQPYRDDPGAAYYDPYRGPVPQTFNDPASAVELQAPGWGGGEAIPMTQMRGKSPGPGPGAYDNGRSSPAPGRRSPGPQAAYGYNDPRMGSPAPPMYGDQRMASPAPMARQASPGPQAAYGQYGPR